MENDYADLYKLVEKGTIKYAEEYNENDNEERHVEVVKTIKRNFNAAQKKPIKQKAE